MVDTVFESVRVDAHLIDVGEACFSLELRRSASRARKNDAGAFSRPKDIHTDW